MTRGRHCGFDAEARLGLWDDGLTVFFCLRHLSAAEGCYSVVAWLLSKGVDVNPIDRFKRTPLEVGHGSAWGTWGIMGLRLSC